MSARLLTLLVGLAASVGWAGSGLRGQGCEAGQPEPRRACLAVTWTTDGTASPWLRDEAERRLREALERRGVTLSSPGAPGQVTLKLALDEVPGGLRLQAVALGVDRSVLGSVRVQAKGRRPEALVTALVRRACDEVLEVAPAQLAVIR